MQQRAIGSDQDLTGRISLSVLFQQRQKKGPWFEPSLGNWGSYVWNVSPCTCPAALAVLWSQVTQFVFVPDASIMYFLVIKKKNPKGRHALGREQQTHILSEPVKLLSNCCRAAGGADICFSPAAGCRPCRSQSPGMPHTFCLFYMSKQIVNWLIIFVLTMSFTAVSLLSALFALFKYEPSGPPLRCSLLH